MTDLKRDTNGYKNAAISIGGSICTVLLVWLLVALFLNGRDLQDARLAAMAWALQHNHKGPLECHRSSAAPSGYVECTNRWHDEATLTLWCRYRECRAVLKDPRLER